MLLLLTPLVSGQTREQLYNPDANALEQIDEAVTRAKNQNKHVLVQVGGNWCSWCYKLHDFIIEHASLDSIIQANYVSVKINYSKENKNPEALKKLDHPQRFGFPVLVILDKTGRRIHTQDTGLLESGGGYDLNKLKRFLLSWNIQAVNP
jgi:thioredoxin-related protein